MPLQEEKKASRTESKQHKWVLWVLVITEHQGYKLAAASP